MTALVVFPGVDPGRRRRAEVFFDRREWRRLMDLYGRMVAAGQWRDYGLERGKGRVAFLVFRHQERLAAYRIVKAVEAREGGAPRRPCFFVTGPDGRILRRAETLNALLAPFERRLLRLWRRDALPG